VSAADSEFSDQREQQALEEDGDTRSPDVLDVPAADSDFSDAVVAGGEGQHDQQALEEDGDSRSSE
jgi:hypothetical protein